jgi:two-component system chemotaxis response regulator CheB
MNPDPSGSKTKVLVVDDSAFYRQTFAEMFRSSGYFEVIGAVHDGVEAMRFLSKQKPDLITLDLEMPKMDGFTFLRWVMSNNPVPIIVVSSRAEKANVFKALELGAADFIAKPSHWASLEIMKIRDVLLSKSEAVARVPVEKLKPVQYPEMPTQAVAEARAPVKPAASFDRMVVIGASTGGPPAITKILSELPPDLSAAYAVAQHMPPVFTHYFAERLDKVSRLKVTEARNRELVEAGHVYVAPGGNHIVFEKYGDKIYIALRPESEEDKYSPSVDQLMKSASEVFGHRTLGVLLTGMGKDGKDGMRQIKHGGGQTLAEAEETAIVFGMPREAILDGVVDKVVLLYDISQEIIRRCS